MTIQTFHELVNALHELDKPPAPVDRTWLVRDKGIDGIEFNYNAGNVMRLLIEARASGVFTDKRFGKLADKVENIRTAMGLINVLRYLSVATGVDLLIPTSERILPRLIRALEALYRHGELDSRPETAKLRSIAREAEAIWKPELSHKVFMAELAKKNNLSERHLYRHFKTMKKLADFKSYLWLNATKSASTRTKSKRKDIALHAKY